MAFSISFGGSATDSRTDRRNGNTRRGRRSGSRTQTPQAKKSSLPFVLAIFMSLLIVACTLGYFVWQDMTALKPDEHACYPQADQAQTVMFVDSSNPRADAQQARDIWTFVSDHYNRRASANERFRIYNTEIDQIGSIPDPAIETCVPASTNAELEALGAPRVNPAYIATQKQRIFDQKIAPALRAMTDPAPAHPQAYESPILEQIEGLSRLPELRDGAGRKSLIVVSDLIQSTHEIRACREPGHLPRFENFKAGEHWARVRPESLAGVDVTLLMLIRPEYGPHCSGEDELIRWWESYFEEAGAQSVQITRLRFDVSGGRDTRPQTPHTKARKGQTPCLTKAPAQGRMAVCLAARRNSSSSWDCAPMRSVNSGRSSLEPHFPPILTGHPLLQPALPLLRA